MEQVVTETYEIRSHRGGVQVVQSIDLSRAGIANFCLLIWFVNVSGREMEESNLHRLKQIIEGDKAERGN